MGDDEGRFLELLYDLGHGEGLARAGYSFERLKTPAGENVANNTVYCPGLIPGGLKICLDCQTPHETSPQRENCSGRWLSVTRISRRLEPR